MSQHVRISQWQMAGLMGSSFTALGLFTYPRDLITGAGRQAVWGLLLAMLFAVVSTTLLVCAGRKFPTQTPIHYARSVFGKPLGTVAALFLILYHAGLAAVSLRYFGDLVNTLFLPRTPIEMSMLLLVVATVYLVWHGLEGVARFVSLVFPIVLLMVAVTFAITFSRVTELEAMLPPPSFDPAAVGNGSWRMMYVFTGIESVTMLLPFVHQPRRPYLYALGAVAANSLTLVLIFFVTVGLWGVEPIAHLQYPGIAALRVLRLPGLLVERLGAFMAVMWTMLALTFLCTRFWTVPTATAQLFGLDPQKARFFLFPMALLTLFLARWPVNAEQLEQIILFVVTPLGVCANLVMSAGLLLVAWLRGLGRSA